MADYERVLLVKNEIFVYKIPPRQSNRGYRAADWDLQNPDWSGRMRLVSNDKTVFLKLEDKSGELFAQCPIESYPGVAVEAVNDSSRYFVIRIMDTTGRTAFIGIGFADRSDSFDLNVTLQDHFKLVQKTEEIEQKEKSVQPALDLAFKEGQTISINIGGKRTGETKRPKATVGGIEMLPPPPFSGKRTGETKRPKATGGGIGMLPPPPGSKIPTLAPPPSTGNPVRGSPSHGRRSPVVQPAVPSSTSAQQTSSYVDSLLDLDMSSNIPVQPTAVSSQAPATVDPFGDLTSFESSTSQPTSANAQASTNHTWMGF